MIARLSRLLPGAAALAAAVALQRMADPAVVDEVVRGYPWVVYGLAFTLAAVFHRSRVALGAATLAAVDVAIVPGAAPLRVAYVGAVAGVLMGGLALGRDRGLWSRDGAPQAIVVLLGSLVATYAWREKTQAVTEAFAWAPLPEDLTAWTGLPQPTLMAFALGGVAIAWGLVRWRGAVEWGLAAGVAALGLATAAGDATLASLYLMAGALALGASVLQITYAMAYQDDLTGLPARRALMRDLDALPGSYTLAMVDVDHFKGFNDRHGHDVGDQVLRMVANRLGKAPGGGKAYRYGGEEFTLVYPGRLQKDAIPHLETVRESVQRAEFTLRGRSRPRQKPKKPTKKQKAARRTLSVTVSIGVADSTLKGANTRGVLKKADQALYRAKEKGRNQVSR